MVYQVVLLTIALGVCFVSTSAHVLPTSEENGGIVCTGDLCRNKRSVLYGMAERVQEPAYYTRECIGDEIQICELKQYKDLETMGCKGGKVYYHGEDVCMCIDDREPICIEERMIFAYHKPQV